MEMQFYVSSGVVSTQAIGSLSLRCPACKQIGTFNSLGQDIGWKDKKTGKMVLAGQKICPNPQCWGHIFVVVVDGKIHVSYPPERIDFDSTSIPEPIIGSLEEAITCHANQCYVASAIMVRKTLELNALGGNLKERVKALGSKAVLPPDLLAGLDDLRLLGNDAAHVESQEYDKVGQEELDVAIEFTKEVLKAIYQYSALLSRIRGLKKQPNP